MRVIVTGAKGFVGKNLVLSLKNQGRDVYEFDREDSLIDLEKELQKPDLWFIYHLAGVNRPENVEDFEQNTSLTEQIVMLMEKHNVKAPILMNSSIQASLDNDYGKSKKAAEDVLLDYQKRTGNRVIIFRCPNVFGKWCRPNYNSVIATFCYNVANGNPLNVNKDAKPVPFIYIDDLISNMFLYTHKFHEPLCFVENLEPIYKKTPAEIADLLYSFRETNFSNDIIVQEGFEKKLYATYLSYLPKEEACHTLNMHIDDRGSFTELYHTPTYGQTSVNIIHPGITKGNHYHHTKNEKFIVVKGTCEIKMRHIITNETYSYICDGNSIQSVDILPGYTHNITNVGRDDAVVIMWANESFDEANPDTFYEEV